MVLVDATGTAVATYAYDAWGVVTVNTESFANGWHNPYLYDGRDGVREDTETGLYWMSVRAYDPTLGRFISQDPLGRAPSTWSGQPYVYAGNNPLLNVDPSGEMATTDIGGGGRDNTDGILGFIAGLFGSVTPSALGTLVEIFARKAKARFSSVAAHWKNAQKRTANGAFQRYKERYMGARATSKFWSVARVSFTILLFSLDWAAYAVTYYSEHHHPEDSPEAAIWRAIFAGLVHAVGVVAITILFSIIVEQGSRILLLMFPGIGWAAARIVGLLEKLPWVEWAIGSAEGWLAGLIMDRITPGVSDLLINWATDPGRCVPCRA